MGAVLEASGLGKRYGDRWLFRKLDFTLARGDGLIVRGRNGSGKSTLLKVLADLLTPTEGVVHREVADSRTGLALSALEMALYPALTVGEHLELAGDLRGCPARKRELLDRIGLAHAATLPAAKISTGMKARLKLALAIQADPAILLLDEPGAAMDEQGKELVHRVCAEQRERGVLVIATNDSRETALGNLELELSA